MDDLNNQPTYGHYQVDLGSGPGAYAIVRDVGTLRIIAAAERSTQRTSRLPVYAITSDENGTLQIRQGEDATGPILATLPANLVDVLSAYFDMEHYYERQAAYYASRNEERASGEERGIWWDEPDEDASELN